MRLDRRRGTSLIELLTAMVIMAALLAIALPKLRATRYQANAGAIQLTLALEQAQRVAVSKQMQVLVRIDSAGHRVQLVEDRDANTAISAGERARWLPLDDPTRFVSPPKRVGGEPAAGAVVAARLDTVATLPTIIFRRDGSASTTTELYLVAAGREVDYRAVLLPRATAHAEWYRYGNGSWLKGAP
ncbi:MAG: pilus assembly FimT family protein [Gemmatimonadaceae bacterium]